MKQKELDKKLYESLFEKDFDLAKDYLDQGADLEFKNKNGNNLFSIFVLKKHLDTALWLRDQGANLNNIDSTGNTILHNFVFTRDHDMLDWLFENCPDLNPNMENKSGSTPLISSLSFEHQNVFEQIMKFNPDINYRNRYGVSALMTACTREENDDEACLLIEQGGDCTVINDKNYTLAHIAAASNANKALKLVIEKHPEFLKAKNIHGETPSASACSNSNIMGLSYLLEQGANPNTPSQPRVGVGKYPIQLLTNVIPIFEKNIITYTKQKMMKELAEQAKNLEAANSSLKYLLDNNKTRLDIKDSAGSPLAIYASGLSSDRFIDLIDRGMPLDVTGSNSKHIVYQLASLKGVEIVKRLYNVIDPELWTKKEDITVDGKGNKLNLTPVNILTLTQNIEALFFLKNENITLKGNLQYVNIEAQSDSIIKAINDTKEKKDLEVNLKKVRDDIKKEASPLIDLLLNAGDDINWTDEKGDSLLMKKSKSGENQMTRLLIEKGADLQQLNKEDRDILLDSVINYYPKESFMIIKDAYVEQFGMPDNFIFNCVLESPEDARRPAFLKRFESLLDSNNINNTDEDGNTALIVAAATEQLDMVNRLLTQGCDPNMVNSACETALLHAANQDNYGMVKEIIEFGGDKDFQLSSGQTIEDLIEENCSEYVIDAIETGLKAKIEKEKPSEVKKNKP